MAQQRHHRQTLYAVGAVVVVVVVVAVLVVVKLTGGSDNTVVSKGGGSSSATVVPAALYRRYTASSSATLAAAARHYTAAQLTYPSVTSDPPLATSGKPEVLYIGAEYCPYCATERWPLVLALSKFGTFSGLTHIHSSPTDVYPNTPTWSFYQSHYSSPYLKFVSVEEETVSEKPLQSPTTAETHVQAKYDPTGTIPFAYLDGKAIINGAEYAPQLLHGMSFSQALYSIAGGTSALASSVDANAGAIVSDLCRVTGGKPGNVCKLFPTPITR